MTTSTDQSHLSTMSVAPFLLNNDLDAGPPSGATPQFVNTSMPAANLPLPNWAKNIFFFGANLFFISVNIIYLIILGSFIWNCVHFLVVILSQALFILLMVTLTLLHRSNPGRLEPATDEQAVPFEKSTYPVPPQSFQYCEPCRQYRPLRTVHCTVCGACITRPDHHCPWIGNCVSRANYHLFGLFLLIVCSYVLLFSVCGWLSVISHFTTSDEKNSTLPTNATLRTTTKYNF